MTSTILYVVQLYNVQSSTQQSTSDRYWDNHSAGLLYLLWIVFFTTVIYVKRCSTSCTTSTSLLSLDNSMNFTVLMSSIWSFHNNLCVYTCLIKSVHSLAAGNGLFTEWSYRCILIEVITQVPPTKLHCSSVWSSALYYSLTLFVTRTGLTVNCMIISNTYFANFHLLAREKLSVPH